MIGVQQADPGLQAWVAAVSNADQAQVAEVPLRGRQGRSAS